MGFTAKVEAPPIREDAHGALRIGGTRVLVELVVQAFKHGATPETIVQQYPTLALSDAYAVIAYYLRHPDEIETYMAERDALADEMQQRWQVDGKDLSAIRERLRARRQG